jgi:hypothetical protein
MVDLGFLLVDRLSCDCQGLLQVLLVFNGPGRLTCTLLKLFAFLQEFGVLSVEEGIAF